MRATPLYNCVFATTSSCGNSRHRGRIQVRANGLRLRTFTPPTSRGIQGMKQGSCTCKWYSAAAAVGRPRVKPEGMVRSCDTTYEVSFRSSDTSHGFIRYLFPGAISPQSASRLNQRLYFPVGLPQSLKSPLPRVCVILGFGQSSCSHVYFRQCTEHIVCQPFSTTTFAESSRLDSLRTNGRANGCARAQHL